MSDAPKTSIRLTLIHNRNKRYPKARYTIERLDEYFGKQWITELTETSWQPEFAPQSRFKVLKSIYVDHLLDWQWARYRNLPWSIGSFPEFLGKFLYTLISYAKNSKMGSQRRIQRAIELALTDKHIRAWQSFIDSDCDFLLVMEDDAMLTDETENEVKNLLTVLSHKAPKDELIYVDLAGGFEVEDLLTNSLKQDLVSGRFRHYSKITTNTACCIILSRKLVEEFTAKTMQSPEYRNIPIDWLMNVLLMKLEKHGGHPQYCLHAEPPILHHGSAKGLMPSTIRPSLETVSKNPL